MQLVQIKLENITQFHSGVINNHGIQFEDLKPNSILVACKKTINIVPDFYGVSHVNYFFHYDYLSKETLYI